MPRSPSRNRQDIGCSCVESTSHGLESGGVYCRLTIECRYRAQELFLLCSFLLRAARDGNNCCFRMRGTIQRSGEKRKLSRRSIPSRKIGRERAKGSQEF